MGVILEQIINFYTSSHDFNWIIASNIDFSDIWDPKQILKELLENWDINMVFSKGNYNIHIQQFPHQSIDKQKKSLNECDLHSIGVYPTRKVLEVIVDKNKYIDKPFTYLLAIWDPQLSYQTFDLSVLENYRNDPRYNLECGDFEWRLSVNRENELDKKDEIFIQSFWFWLDKNWYRCIVCFLRYLSDITPTHQKIWEAKIKPWSDFEIHDIYAKSTIWDRSCTDYISMFDATIEEIKHINNMTKNIKWTSLFNDEFEKERPKEFWFLLRPTQKAFYEFIHLLDKMVSENINRDFFKWDINLEKEIERDDWKIIIEQKWTLSLLFERIEKNFLMPNIKPFEEAKKIFKEIRNIRQIPSHTIYDDKYDLEYFKKQRELMINLYWWIRNIRLLVENHPKNKEYKEIPDYLKNPEYILTY